MASISSTLMATALNAALSIHGERLTVLSGTDAGRVFRGMILTQPSITLGGDLGDDPREKVMAHFPASNVPALKSGNQIQDESNGVWKVVQRVDNPADSSVDFELVKIVTGKDL